MNQISQAQLKSIIGLHRKKKRLESQLYIIEGPKMVKEALHFIPDLVENIYATTDLFDEFNQLHANVFTISSTQFNKISCLTNPQGILAVVATKHKKAISTNFQLALDNIQDPGNLGTILRTASWFGVDEILLSENCVELYNPKVVQASMGALFHLAIRTVSLTAYLDTVKKPIYGALLKGESLDNSIPIKNCILVVGNEGNGISEDVKSKITHPITISKKGSGESLNVAVATGIILNWFKKAY